MKTAVRGVWAALFVAVIGCVLSGDLSARKPILVAEGFDCHVPGVDYYGNMDDGLGAYAFQSLASLEEKNGRVKVVCRADVENESGARAIFRRFLVETEIPDDIPYVGGECLTTNITSLNVPASGDNARLVIVFNINYHVHDCDDDE